MLALVISTNISKWMEIVGIRRFWALSQLAVTILMVVLKFYLTPPQSAACHHYRHCHYHDHQPANLPTHQPTNPPTLHLSPSPPQLVLALLPYAPLPETEPGGPMLSNTKGIIALFMYTLTGFPWACKMVIPYALIARTYKGDPDLALYRHPQHRVMLQPGKVN